MVHGLGSNIAAPSSQKSVVPATTVKNQRTDVRTDVKTERHPSSQSNSDNTVKQKNQSSSDREKEMENNKRRMLMTSFSQGISTVGEKRIEKKPAAQEVTVRAALTSKSSSTVSSSSSSNVSNVSKSTASSNMSSSNSNCSQGVPASKAIDQKSLFGYNYTDTLSQVDQAGADQPSQPSKRARMMLQAALQAPQPVVKRDLKNVIASINASKARNQLGGSEKENCKDRQAAMAAGKISKKYVCTVCKNDAAEPCAAKCGHICCESCWSQWLRRSETCPCCRAPTMLQQIKKITIVKC